MSATGFSRSSATTAELSRLMKKIVGERDVWRRSQSNWTRGSRGLFREKISCILRIPRRLHFLNLHNLNKSELFSCFLRLKVSEKMLLCELHYKCFAALWQ